MANRPYNLRGSRWIGETPSGFNPPRYLNPAVSLNPYYNLGGGYQYTYQPKSLVGVNYNVGSQVPTDFRTGQPMQSYSSGTPVSAAVNPAIRAENIDRSNRAALYDRGVRLGVIDPETGQNVRSSGQTAESKRIILRNWLRATGLKNAPMIKGERWGGKQYDYKKMEADLKKFAGTHNYPIDPNKYRRFHVEDKSTKMSSAEKLRQWVRQKVLDNKQGGGRGGGGFVDLGPQSGVREGLGAKGASSYGIRPKFKL